MIRVYPNCRIDQGMTAVVVTYGSSYWASFCMREFGHEFLPMRSLWDDE